MIKSEQNAFYKALGSLVKSRRQNSGMSIAHLAKASGEQNKTIRHIEDGNACHMHHLVWMDDLLNIRMETLAMEQHIQITEMENNNGKEEKTNQEESSTIEISNLEDLI